ncbi:hypothetical protein AMTR_s00167p00020150 [Amborella trichopoda]|uniref:Uncharacterized protein n=1 Tax=Amborella trichopoda TaxID=13333 RepID=W1PLI5_AMBTC|nr:hypothetical protein AMTR_s00167p00020150 [Amborella trichopoda]
MCRARLRSPITTAGSGQAALTAPNGAVNLGCGIDGGHWRTLTVILAGSRGTCYTWRTCST